MPRVEASLTVPVDVDTAFAVSQTHGETRLLWDPFIKSQHLVNADRPAKGVQTATVSRHRLKMVSQYVSFRPPHQVGMKMVKGPWFFDAFAGGWRFDAVDEADSPEASGDAAATTATWRYTFTVRPSWLAPIADPIGRWLLGRDIRARIAAFAAACEHPEVLAAVAAADDAT